MHEGHRQIPQRVGHVRKTPRTAFHTLGSSIPVRLRQASQVQADVREASLGWPPGEVWVVGPRHMTQESGSIAKPTNLTPVSDSDFSGLISQSRERLGLTTSRVAELIGRSPGTLRAWEKGTSRPTEDSVVSSLAAVLGIEERVLFEAAGLEPPVLESSPSMRQALSTLTPRDRVERSDHPDGTASGREATADRPEDSASFSRSGREPGPNSATLDGGDDEESTLAETASSTVAHVRTRGRSGFADRLRAATVRRAPRPASAPSTLPPVPMAPSYMEDANERWSYRLRSIYTAAGVLLMFIVLGWAASNFLESLGELWSQLTANL